MAYQFNRADINEIAYIVLVIRQGRNDKAINLIDNFIVYLRTYAMDDVIDEFDTALNLLAGEHNQEAINTIFHYIHDFNERDRR